MVNFSKRQVVKLSKKTKSPFNSEFLQFLYQKFIVPNIIEIAYYACYYLIILSSRENSSGVLFFILLAIYFVAVIFCFLLNCFESLRACFYKCAKCCFIFIAQYVCIWNILMFKEILLFASLGENCLHCKNCV